MKKITILLILMTLIVTNMNMLVADNKLKLQLNFPAKNWSGECFPIGNGRLGGMIYGGIDKEEIQFNVDSLWTGNENPSGGYDNHNFGAYQNFGSIIVNFGATRLSCPSGHKSYSSAENILKSVDGDTKTKWCVEHNDKPVQWQISLTAPVAINSYSFTSGNDASARDPKEWIFAGSQDGKSWTDLDKRTDQPALASRCLKKDYTFTNQTPYQYYRFTFLKNNGGSRYQLSEIKLKGVNANLNNNVTGYLRELDLATAVSKTTYRKNNIKYVRESFASAPAQVMVSKFSASKKGAYSATISLEDAHKGKLSLLNKNTLQIKGNLSNGLAYEALLYISCKGGKMQSQNNSIILTKCDSFTLYLAADTNYLMDYSKKWRGADPHKKLISQIKKAVKTPYEQLKTTHIKDYQFFFNRITINLGKSTDAQEKMPVNKRIEAFKKNPDNTDPELIAMLFQYGRYLLISCSRPGTLPANLQGLWNNSNTPPWHSDYHTNINVQMNYWLAEPANLAECNLPFIEMTEAITEPAKKATRKAFGAGRGFTYRTSLNIFGGNGWQWNIPSSAWYAQHLWEHYAFTQDKKYLKETAYPYLKEVCEYWEDHLKKLPDGTLVVPNGWSPEHGPREDGVAHDQQIVWDLFSNYIDASKSLNVDAKYRQKISKMRAKLLGPKIGKWGQLQEWVEDRDNPKDQHRHTSHLFAVYPGRQISLSETPGFAKAAMISLKARGTSGDSRRSWTWPWRCALWARFHKSEECYNMIRGLLRYNTLPNLLTTHPPMQMDGSFGITAGMCEMFIQSHSSVIEILPALPSQWAEGNIHGLCARGGFVLDLNWENGKLSKLKVLSKAGKSCILKYGDKTRKLSLKAGKSITLNGNLK